MGRNYTAIWVSGICGRWRNRRVPAVVPVPLSILREGTFFQAILSGAKSCRLTSARAIVMSAPPFGHRRRATRLHPRSSRKLFHICFRPRPQPQTPSPSSAVAARASACQLLCSFGFDESRLGESQGLTRRWMFWATTDGGRRCRQRHGRQPLR